MQIFISTGEVSGDLQGAMLVEALYRLASLSEIELEIVALGGDRMKTAGASLIANTARIGSVGLLEAIPFVLPTLKIQRQTQQYLRQNPPDILVLIDYPASNLAIASFVNKHLPQVPIIYYIAPQDWAAPMLGNTNKITKLVDKILAIFPEEANYFKARDVEVNWIGHPLLDRLASAPDRETARKTLSIKPQEQIITLLPASRQQEIEYLLPIICQAAREIQQHLPKVRFLIPISLEIYRQQITAAVAEYNLPATILKEQTLEAIAAADLAIAKSGTVNLEIALLNIPQVIIYRLNPVTAWVARYLLGFDIPLISPPNLVVGREIVPELVQERATVDNLRVCALELLLNERKRQQIFHDYQQMRSLLGKVGVCDRAALEILKFSKC
ncbi:lipid-A-disaccharide synthase [Myxosarcina sp. GI1]|uniref:lipid-A-disaccharide synthase n=1 Tax=Myxosarcina sp. GI1 TaxID=1541065 RepID=UPI000565DFF3|nr:lipid-A-disaccharide synthase [Myxosarcina sp. GI1]